MAALITSVVKVGPRAWRYDWSGTSPYKVYSPTLDVNSNATTQAFYIAEWNDYEHTPDTLEPPILEVIDATQTTADVLTLTYPNRLKMQWRAADSFSKYFLIQVNNGGTWVKKQYVSHTADPGYYSFLTTGLTDGSSHNWRAVPLDEGGTTGNPLNWTVAEWTTLPDYPSISGSYSSGTGNLTISAR